MKNIIISAITALLVSIIALVLVGGNQSAPLRVSGTTNFNDLVLAKDNGATSTVSVGCVQTLATSSATTIKLVFNTVASSTGNGFTLWSYGTCP